MADPNDITGLLARVRTGDRDALGQLTPLLYDQLRRLAQQQRRRHRPGETLNTTALVHEAYEKLARGSATYADRQHFLRIAARAMRYVLTDYARAQRRLKRGGDHAPLPLDTLRLAAAEHTDDLLALDEALTRLAERDTRQAEVVELRYFVGLTIPETAEVLDLSEATVKRDWTAARAWLHVALSEAA